MTVRVRKMGESRLEIEARRRRFVATLHGPDSPICAIRGWWVRELSRDARGVDWQTEVGVGFHKIRDVRAAVAAEVGAA